MTLCFSAALHATWLEGSGPSLWSGPSLRKINWVIPRHCCGLSARPESPGTVSSRPVAPPGRRSSPQACRPHLALALLGSRYLPPLSLQLARAYQDKLCASRCAEGMAMKRMQLLTCRTQSPERETRETHGTHTQQRLGALRQGRGGPQVLCERDKEISAK